MNVLELSAFGNNAFFSLLLLLVFLKHQLGCPGDGSLLRWGKAASFVHCVRVGRALCAGSGAQALAGRAPWPAGSLLQPWLETWPAPEGNPPLPKSELRARVGEERPFKTKTARIRKIKPKDLAGQVAPAKHESAPFSKLENCPKNQTQKRFLKGT